VRPEEPNLKVNAREVILHDGRPFEFVCSAGRPIESCNIKFGPKPKVTVKIRVNTKKDDYEYFGTGFENGDCGVRYFKAIKEEHEGNATCTVSYPDYNYDSTAWTNLIFATAPTSFELSAKSVYKEGDELDLRCSAPGGRPAPNITLLLGKT